MRFAVDKNNIRVCIDNVDKSEVFYCQECGEKLVQKRGEIIAHHFAHYPNTQCIDNWHYDESEWHYQMQNLFPNDTQEVVMELENTKHIADVFIKERNLVVEFQGDRIRQTEFASRNNFFSKLGYKVLWIFDESRPFENESIDGVEVNKAITRGWSRASKTFEGFHPEDNPDIEVWFTKYQEYDDDEPNYFRVLSDDRYKGFGIMGCSRCYSKNELIQYILHGIKTIDRSVLYDIHWAIKRNDGLDYFYSCPLSQEKFTSIEECYKCKYCERFQDNDEPNYVECSGRCRNLDLGKITSIVSVERNTEGFINLIRGSTEDGEIIDVKVEVPPTSLRTMAQLWDKYQPLRYLYCFNTKTKRLFRVFNPAWQKRKTGVVKGKLIRGRRFEKDEIEIYGADNPVWIVTYFVRLDN